MPTKRQATKRQPTKRAAAKRVTTKRGKPKPPPAKRAKHQPAKPAAPKQQAPARALPPPVATFLEKRGEEAWFVSRVPGYMGDVKLPLSFAPRRAHSLWKQVKDLTLQAMLPLGVLDDRILVLVDAAQADLPVVLDVEGFGPYPMGSWSSFVKRLLGADDPTPVEALQDVYRRAKGLQRSGDHQALVELLRGHEQQLEDLALPPHDELASLKPALLQVLGLGLEGVGDGAGAEEAWRRGRGEALHHLPQANACAVELCRWYVEKRQPAAVLEVAEDLVQHVSEIIDEYGWFQARRYRALAWTMLGRTTEAVEAYARLTKKYDGDADTVAVFKEDLAGLQRDSAHADAAGKVLDGLR